jgi:enoyl-CoA hydratase/carnithine racemase
VALEMLWLAGPMKPERLLALGLVNRVTDKGQALAEALALADRLAAMAPNAVAGAKELVARAALSPLGEHLEAERRQFIVNLFHDNGGEGLTAFFEKRPPAFR